LSKCLAVVIPLVRVESYCSSRPEIAHTCDWSSRSLGSWTFSVHPVRFNNG